MSYEVWIILPKPGISHEAISALYENPQDGAQEEDYIQIMEDEALYALVLRPALRAWIDVERRSLALQVYLVSDPETPFPEALRVECAQLLGYDLPSRLRDSIAGGRLDLDLSEAGELREALKRVLRFAGELEPHGFVAYDPQYGGLLNPRQGLESLMADAEDPGESILQDLAWLLTETTMDRLERGLPPAADAPPPGPAED